MEEKIAIIGIFVKDMDAVKRVNSELHDFSDKIIGRMGIPRTGAGINVISVIINASADDINALSGKLGKIEGISTKTMQAKF